jgi:ribosomal protein S18 acetylase RimI-like enzyme
MDIIEIKRVFSKDVKQLQEIARQTFYETFSEQNTPEDMQNYLENNLSSDKLKQELEEINSEFYFSIYDNKVIGYLKINYGLAQTEIKDQKSVEIERIYVLKTYHGKNVGQVLYEKALDIASIAKAHSIWLGVWEKNRRAINFYKKNGFVEFDKHIFKLGNDNQTDIMMRLQLA